MDTKFCKKCGQMKTLDRFEFYKKKGKYVLPCKDCDNLTERIRRSKLSREEKNIRNEKIRKKYFEQPYSYKSLKRNALVWNRGLFFTQEELYEWIRLQKQECIYCGITPEEIRTSNFHIYDKYKRLTIDRLNNNVGYKLDNIGLACMVCNRTKSNIFTYEQMKEVGIIIRNSIHAKTAPSG